jgi:hypothetical protein
MLVVTQLPGLSKVAHCAQQGRDNNRLAQINKQHHKRHGEQ